jgi:ribonuclease HI
VRKDKRSAMKQITIATDISCDSVHQITTWACYIKHNKGEIKQTGEFKEFYNNTTLAETYALVNALTIAHNNIPDWSESSVTIYNEIEHVLDPVKTKAGNVKLRDKDRYDVIKEIAIPILLEAMAWEKKDVKAHYRHWKKTGEEKYILNRWCDQKARQVLREIRDKKVLALI